MSYMMLLNDRCTIQTRTVDSTGKQDNETWTSQPKPTRCRVIKQVSQRRTSPDGADKVRYGAVVSVKVVLPRNAEIVLHDRILHNGRVYDVAEVIEGRDHRGAHHLTAICEARA